MCEKEPPTGISDEDWATTPDSVRALVYALLTSYEQLRQRVADMEERVHQTSRNSSKSPSSDPPSAPPHP